MSFSCITVTPTSLSSRPKPKQWSFTAMCSSYTDRPSSLPIILKIGGKKLAVVLCTKITKYYNVKVSLNFGDQTDCLILVTCFRFLSDKCGPMRLTSTKGLKVWVLGHLRSLATTTLTVTLCSPVPGCVNKSIWTDTSPALSSSPTNLSE